MQNEPEKTVGNYNELRSEHTPIALPTGVIKLYTGEEQFDDWQVIIATSLELVSNKVREVLGENNQLTNGPVALPSVTLLQTDPEHPNWAGYFSWHTNETTLVLDKIEPEFISRLKVSVHEFFHFMSHNGRDDTEQAGDDVPISEHNNIGFSRNFGRDIREGREGKLTSDYFVSYNEAITELLARDVVPGVHETYGDYIGLTDQVIDDAVALKLGTQNEFGTHIPWSRDQIKNHIYALYFRGDLAGFTNLLQTIYAKFDITEQQFGLMTNKDDLPSIIEKKLIHDNPGGPPPAPSKVAQLVQQRLNAKKPSDYPTDTIDRDPRNGGGATESKYGSEYDEFVESNNITISKKENVGGTQYDMDNTGLIIYHGEEAKMRLSYITDVFDSLLVMLERGEVDTAYINEQIDNLLFVRYQMSMLSDGFKDFYIYKHTKLDPKKPI
jgi:hypothetical protein